MWVFILVIFLLFAFLLLAVLIYLQNRSNPPLIVLDSNTKLVHVLGKIIKHISSNYESSECNTCGAVETPPVRECLVCGGTNISVVSQEREEIEVSRLFPPGRVRYKLAWGSLSGRENVGWNYQSHVFVVAASFDPIDHIITPAMTIPQLESIITGQTMAETVISSLELENFKHRAYIKKMARDLAESRKYCTKEILKTIAQGREDIKEIIDQAAKERKDAISFAMYLFDEQGSPPKREEIEQDYERYKKKEEEVVAI